ncbi:MAG: chromate resistance protein [Chloroflexi bacterium]|nr:MAG: chromate resistance protein [Chloroflexota bacterium]
MRFVTRERIHVDRIATAWAITRFIDPDATFEFVPRTRDIRGLDAIPFDIRGAELSHRGERCTLEALIDKYELRDPALAAMARIIRAADLPDQEPAPAIAVGVKAIFDGIRDGSQTDEERLAKGAVVCDALYAFCRRHKEAAADV